MRTLFVNGSIVSPTAVQRADLLVADGRVVAVGDNLPGAGAKIVDAGGGLILPGGVDAHTHITLDLDAALGADAYSGGTIPAACGGTTSIVDHMAFMPEGRDIEEQFRLYRRLADGRAVVDYAFHAVMQDMREETPALLERLAARGIVGVKAYTTYDHRLNDRDLLELLRLTKRQGMLTLVHAEDHEAIAARREALSAEQRAAPINHARSRPAASEASAVARVLALAAEAGDAPVYIVHISTAAGLEAVKKARASGQRHIFAETCTQYLTLTEERYLGPDGLACIMSPPLRAQSDVDALWAGLREGHIQVVATDHCSFTTADKARGRGDFTRCPGGAPGLEERLIVLYSEGVAKNRISPQRFVQLTAAAPAAIFGLSPAKGTLTPGADADLFILDPQARAVCGARSLHGPSDYSLYEGMELTGCISSVYLRGKRIFHEGRFTGSPGDGRFLPQEAPA